jgi:hypothetical protein
MRRELTMTRLSVALLAMIHLALGSGAVAAQTGGAGAAGQTVHTVVLDRDDVEPGRVTLAKGDGLSFRNTRSDLVKVVFRGKGDVSKQITCKRPAGAPPGPDIKAMQGPQGNDLHVYVPPGLFPGVCTFAAGDYTFDVVAEVGLPTDEVPPQGQVSAK